MNPTETVILKQPSNQFRLIEAAKACGMSLPGASTTLRRMIDKGYLKRVKRGVYEKL